MKENNAPKTIRLSEYQPPNHLIDETKLDFRLFEEATLVSATLSMRVNPDVANAKGKPLELVGADLEGFDEDVVDELRRRAKDALLTKALVSEEKLEGEQAPAEDLLNMDGMDTTTAYALAKVGIITMDDLAEQAVDELMVVDGMDEERAAQLIMTARAPWFEDQE